MKNISSILHKKRQNTINQLSDFANQNLEWEELNQKLAKLVEKIQLTEYQKHKSNFKSQ